MIKEKLLTKIKGSSLAFGVFALFAFPASTNYKLDSFEFGGGGGVDVSSTNYAIEGILGELGGEPSSTNYEAWAGLVFVQQANVPTAPAFQNSGNWYNKLEFIITPSNNPSDATFAIAITDDNWTTTKWVQNDNTVGTTLGIEDFQTYSQWGGASGEFVIGLETNITYKIKVKARRGKYTESPLGPEAQATTLSPSLSFDIDVAQTDQETAPPYSVSLGDLVLGGVTTATDKIWIDLDTNAEAGGYVYTYDQYTGLRSGYLSYTIDSLTGDLATSTEGFGVRGDSASQTSGGPLVVVSPYNGNGDNVGLVDTVTREIFSSSGNPITSGRGSFLVKVKTSVVTPAASDYTDTLTLIASVTF